MRSFFARKFKKAPKKEEPVVDEDIMPKDFAKQVLDLELKIDKFEFTLPDLNKLIGLYSVCLHPLYK
jgi:hypothetical protein